MSIRGAQCAWPRSQPQRARFHALDALLGPRLWLNWGTVSFPFQRKCGSKSRYVVSKPSKESGARKRLSAQAKGSRQAGSTSAGAGAARPKSAKAKTKKDLENEVAELKRMNAELQEQLHRQEARAEELARINQEAGERVEKAIGRIRTILAS